ncbi:MAG: hypothetical protein H6825_01940 [Planctomycetes bacterium]|nr:hypothetical protein [Planctomycetota bacterium]
MRPIPCAVVPLLAALTVPAFAGEADLKIRADDATPLDFFGSSVAIDGTHMLVGAPLDASEPGQGSSGSAYLFDLSGVQQAKLLPGPFTNGWVFGTSVALDGDVAAVGAPFKIDGFAHGEVHLFDASTAQLLHVLEAGDGAPADHFGSAVAVSSGRVLVGAWADDDSGANSGSAYLFDASTGAELLKLLPDDGAAGDWFGHAVALDGDLAVVSALFSDDAVLDGGKVYVFDASTGDLLHELVADDASQTQYFGFSVAVSDGKVLVGAMFDDAQGNSSGAAYLFDASSGAQLAKLLPADGTAGQWFGRSVALSGDLAVVGAERDDGAAIESGSAYLFDAATFAQLAKYTAPDATHFDRLGNAVDVDGTRVLIGASSDDASTGHLGDAGAAYLLDLDAPTWLEEGHGLAGLAGVPTLSGTGDLVAGSPFTIELSGARAGAPAYFILGLSNLTTPFKGGSLVPAPDLIVPGFVTDGAGGITLASTFGAGVPSSTAFHVQYWIVDAAGPAGFSASTGLRGVTP